MIKPIRHRNPVAVGIVGLLLLALIGFGAYRADSLPFIGGGTTYSADFTESAGLGEGDEVRIAGVKVGKVTGVSLDGAKVKVTFKVKDAWIGNASTVGIAIKTLLGEKYLAVDPLGDSPQDPDERITASRTTSPYDVTQAFNGLGETIGEIDTEQLAKSFETISATFKDSPPDVKSAAKGLSALSKTVSERDAQLATLLKGSKKLTKTLANKKSGFETLLDDGNLLLGEIQARRDSIHLLLTGTRDLGTQLTGLVSDNNKQLKPTLKALGRVTAVLKKNRKSLDQVLALAGSYNRLVGNTLGNGRWFDNYVCGVVPKNYLPANRPPATGCMPPKQEGGH
ncbi:phospholipid/cholesterol/gamma-HCH transport system substrate-binding protein [Streptomyces sp. KhCrAH-43]|uniref:MCE family protein n=1 Tax=Streptomyces TaxID=1883 RepID=UPI0003675473|nr:MULTISPECIES: MCE family protein [unclassified Streptomyces]MYS35787.1 MCE family protein [Streptomyces sp. SID4920]MYX68864.1 MCE family protein [Streptomyces sp. SID8373]RAJ53848.1 phospholipid/cholesterol/gamma-HCH transport system substrate-binding protein [Streptomyces sp. KhCrAH-43]